MPPKTPSAPKILKIAVFPFSTFLASFLLTQEMVHYFKNLDFLSINLLSLPKITATILVLECIIGLSAPTWNNKKYLITASLPLSLGIYLNLFVLEPLNALIICGLIFLFVSYCLDSSLELQNLLSKNIPAVTLRTAIKGCMLGISITAFFIVLLNPQGKEVNLENIVSKAISFSLQQSSIETKNLAEWGIPEESKVLEKEMTDQITESVKKALEPYSHLLNVIMAFLVFLGMQGINTLIYLVFSLIIGPLYWIGKKIGYFKVESETVQRERLSI